MSKEKSASSLKRLKYIATINPSPTTQEIYNRDNLVSFYPMEAIPQPGQAKRIANFKVLGEVIAGYTYFRNNDFVFAKVTPCFENGKAGLMQDLKNGIGFGSTELTVIRAKDGLSDIHFLGYVVRSDRFRSRGESEMTGAGGLKRVPDQFVRDFITYAPLVREQRQIAAYLNRETGKLDMLIAKQQKLIKLLQEKRQAVISQAVTKGLDSNVRMKDSGIEWLGEVPQHWTVTKLGYLGHCQNGINIGGESFGSGFPFISYGDVYKNRVLPLTGSGLVESTQLDRQRYDIRRGDVIFTRTSETIEEIGFSSVCMTGVQDAVFAGFLIRFRPAKDQLSPEFSKYFFQNQKLRQFFTKQMNIVTRASLSQDLLKKMAVPLPLLDEQFEIARLLDKRDKEFNDLIYKSNQVIELLKEHRQALITAAVTGKIDVRGLVTDAEVAALDVDPGLETTEENFESEVEETNYITEEE